ncbi:MAG: hypothetical protein EOO56_07520 [Hymenobacter sp.]|nr:MAG: hypothetical protein EOO56_07520 [Hymenobacter sp.]
MATSAALSGPPFPTQLPYAKADIAKLFGVLDVEQDPNSALHFGVLMPLQWGQIKGERHLVTPQRPFELRTEVKSLTGPAASVKVYIAYVAQELSPSDWLAIYLEHQGERVLRERHLAQEGGAVPDVLTISGKPGAERISRWLVLKNWAKTGGAHFFLVQASTSMASYTPDMANIFFMAVSNFSLTHPTDWNYAEQLRTLVRAVPAKLSTVFPLSWQQQENPRSDEHFYQVKLTKELGGHQIGLINLMLLAGQTEADVHRLEEETRAGYEAEKLNFAPATFTATPAFGPFQQVYTALTPQLNAAAGTPAQERQVLLGHTGNYWVYLENVRLTQATAPEEWAISKRAFEIVQEHLVVKP